jgi:hypothetical protein
LPRGDASESLELTDPDMIAALEHGAQAVQAAVARPGRLRGMILAGTAAGPGAGGTFWLPGALVTHTASVVPFAQRAEIGQRVLDDLSRVTGAPCNNQLRAASAGRLSERVFGPVDTPILYVLPEGVEVPLHLPGDVIILPRRLIENAERPGSRRRCRAGRAAARQGRRPDCPPAGICRAPRDVPASDHGGLPDSALSGYGEAALRTTPELLDTDVLILAFKAAQIPATPYALAIDPDGAPRRALAEGDPYKGLSPSPLDPGRILGRACRASATAKADGTKRVSIPSGSHRESPPSAAFSGPLLPRPCCQTVRQRR